MNCDMLLVILVLSQTVVLTPLHTRWYPVVLTMYTVFSYGPDIIVDIESVLFPTTGAHRSHYSHNDSLESKSLISGKTDSFIWILTGVSREVIGKYAPSRPRLYPCQSNVSK
uniref:Uncharacterized protein n=1 Tax=uncultured haloarchaeon TaxID=160804 RepID=A0A0K1YBI2_9EURY|nr:hypothetical protein [uncultured haloarchaeon]